MLKIVDASTLENRYIRLSVTDLDGYAYWRMSEKSELADLADRLCHVDPPSEAMLVGRAFEAALFGEPTPGFEFFGDVEPVQAVARQQFLKVPMRVDDAMGGPWELELRGRVDGLWVDEVLEIKTTGRAIDLARYAASPQWKCYLLGTGLDRVRYEVYQVCRDRERGPGAYEVRDHQTLVLRRSALMENDVLEISEKTLTAVKCLLDEGLVQIDERGRLKRTQPPEGA